MESPVVVDKPPEFYGKADRNERGFPFDEEEGSGAWSELAARHPDIAARLRQRPATATWARKRRPSSQDADDFGESFGGFDRFPFDDIPTEFREHLPSHWNRRFGSRDEPHPQPQPQSQPQPQTSQSPPQHQTTATQTEHDPPPPEEPTSTFLPQYGLRNTVDLGQKSAADPSVVDAEERNQRSVSAPPDSRAAHAKMSGTNHHESHEQQPGTVHHIPIFVEGRDKPVINKSPVDHGTCFGDTKSTQVPSEPFIDRDTYFSEEGDSFHPPPNFTRSFGAPGFRQGSSQPFTQQKAYPKTAFARGPSPQRSQSPKPQPHQDGHSVNVPVHHAHAAPKAEPPKQKQPSQQPQRQPPPPQQRQQPPVQQPQQEAPPPPPPQPSANDPITQILAIQTDVLNLMTEVENFTGSKKDKRYIFLDEMLTRNLIKLDDIETGGKENIRQARKEAIKCIQKCIAVLEAKAEKGVDAPEKISDMENTEKAVENATENGEVEMQSPKEEAQPQESDKPEEQKPQEIEAHVEKDKRHEEVNTEEKVEQGENVDKKSDPKATNNVKKRDKSKDKQKLENSNTDVKVETMQVDDKGDSQAMEVDGAASQ